MDCRLKTMPYEIDGHELTLSCNMNVLADLQEQYGDVEELLDSERSMRSYLRTRQANRKRRRLCAETRGSQYAGQVLPEEQKPARLSLSEYLMGRCE